MLSNAIGSLLPSAIGVALSPIPIIAVVLMLATPKAKPNGSAFAAGWLLGLAGVSAVVIVVFGGADSSSAQSDGTDTLKIVLGIVFLAMARRQWSGRPKAGEEPTFPSWMSKVDHFAPGKAFTLGLALSAANPKNLALTLAASASIAQAGLSAADDVVAVAVFVALGSVTVVGSVLFYLVATDKAEPKLAELKDFMAAHNAVIMMVVLLILGFKLLGDGLAITN